MTTAVEVLKGRLTREEGEEDYPYDDVTGFRVRAPKGHISWGRGFNLEECGSSGLYDVMEDYLLEEIHHTLLGYSWYAGITDPYRQSVPLDIAYNGGIHDLLGYPHMIAAIAKGDWAEAARQCTDKEPKLDESRYAPLRNILLYGNPT